MTATSVNDPPFFTSFQASASTPPAGTAVLQPSVAIGDPDKGAMIAGAQVAITGGFLAGDQLTVTPSAGITAGYNAATGVLTLAGSATDGRERRGVGRARELGGPRTAPVRTPGWLRPPPLGR